MGAVLQADHGWRSPTHWVAKAAASGDAARVQRPLSTDLDDPAARPYFLWDEDVTVADNSYAGIGLSEASGARLTRVTAAGNDAIGIAAYRANGLVLTDSLVAGNTDTLRYQDEQEQYRESAGFKTTESHKDLLDN